MTLTVDEQLMLIEGAAQTFGELTLDTEGFPHAILGVSAAFEGWHEGIYFPIGHYSGNITALQRIKLQAILKKLDTANFHNATHDLRVLSTNELEFTGNFNCTMLMSHWLWEEEFNYSLDSMCRKYGLPMKNRSAAMQRIIDEEGWACVPAEMMRPYAANDAYVTHLLKNQVVPKFFDEFSPDLWGVEQRFIRRVMIPMMELGIKVDLEFVTQEYLRGESVMEQCIKELGFKPSLTTKLAEFITGTLGLPIVKHTKACKKCYPLDKQTPVAPVATHKAKPSFDKYAMEIYDELLEVIEDDRAKTILKFKGWQKTNSSNYLPYMHLIDKERVIRPSYKLHGTKTGRLSCEKPNLQQIPKTTGKDWNGQLKKAFIARPGWKLWSIDYSQLQFRMTCAYAEQWDLIEIFNEIERDIFDEIAARMAWLRDNVKTLVYLILFGGGANRAAAAFGVTLGQGAQIVGEFHDNYPRIKKIAKQAENAARKQGYVSYWTGRRRHFRRGSAYYRAFNSVIQGGEAEIMKRAMLAVQEEVCDENCRLVLQIHDEIVAEIKEGMEDHYLPLIQKAMENATLDFCKYVGVDLKFKTSAKPWGAK